MYSITTNLTQFVAVIINTWHLEYHSYKIFTLTKHKVTKCTVPFNLIIKCC